MKAFIFDLDGVIVGTDEYHYLAWKQVASGENIYFDKEINNRLRGVSRMESLEIILENAKREYTPEEKKILAEKKNDIYKILLANLFSNAARNGASYAVVRCLPDRALEYEDDSRGLNADAVRLLHDGMADQQMMERGGIGLLMVRHCSLALGWGLQCFHQAQGVHMTLQVPPFEPDNRVILLEDDSLDREIRKDQMRLLLQREFVSLLPEGNEAEETI